MTLLGIEPATFQLLAQCLNQLRHHIPPLSLILESHIKSVFATNCLCYEKKQYTHIFPKTCRPFIIFDTLCALMPLKNLWENLPTLATERWNFNLKLNKSARQKRSRLAIFFQNIVESCEDWDSFYVLQEQGFQAGYIFKKFPS